jgi:apolipoprotein D and lipocalin family protein
MNPGATLAAVRPALCAFFLALTGMPGFVQADTDDTQPLQALPQLELSTYTGTWYQVAWFPNRFQSQCVSDTTATYHLREDGTVDVLNRCRLADGSFDSAAGLARPAGSRVQGDILRPAQLQVSFLPAWLRWLPVWGDYWVIQRPAHGRYAVISEASRKYLWVLARAPALEAEDIEQVRSRLVEQGFDLAAWQLHPQTRPQLPPQPQSAAGDAASAEPGRARRPATPAPAQAR